MYYAQNLGDSLDLTKRIHYVKNLALYKNNFARQEKSLSEAPTVLRDLDLDSRFKIQDPRSKIQDPRSKIQDQELPTGVLEVMASRSRSRSLSPGILRVRPIPRTAPSLRDGFAPLEVL
jgi:hypothetical protein